uniref:Uncharacterized protein n=1 Tax=Rhizophora mucronata TaxID=61149 RepID=A0A2P2Q0P9_RHIMU
MPKRQTLKQILGIVKGFPNNCPRKEILGHLQLINMLTNIRVIWMFLIIWRVLQHSVHCDICDMQHPIFN